MNISFIDPESYFLTFYIAIVLFAALCFFNAVASDIGSRGNMIFLRVLAPFMFCFVLLIISLRPVDAIFIDMSNYNRIFYDVKMGYAETTISDPIFNSLIYATSYFSPEFFFFVCANIYVWPLYFAYRTWFGRYWPYAFLMVAGSLSFFSFGVNTIRNGMAASLFIYALSRTKKVEIGGFMVLAAGMHLSILFPIAFYFCTKFYSSSKLYILFWLLCIPLSLSFGINIRELVSYLGFDDRVSYLTNEQDIELFSSKGFRWDFLAYSFVPVLFGAYFTIYRGYKDRKYESLFCIYLACNGFWILVMESNYTSRIAYLSWMIYDLIVIFPLLRERLMRYQNAFLSLVAIFNALLTIVVINR